MVSDVAIVRRLAHQMWGQVQKQNKVADGVWWIDCSGHGGYIVNTAIYKELKGYEHRVFNGTKKENEKEYLTWLPSEQHFAPFEEDCAYAIVEWLHPYILKRMYKMYRTKLSFEEWQLERLESSKRSLQMYYGEVLLKYPNYGKLTK